MQNPSPYPIVIIISLLFTTACGNLVGVNSNAFEFRYPIIRCNGDIQVADPEPDVLLGQEVDASRGIWLLTPDVIVTPPKLHNRDDDQEYLNQMSDFVAQRVENQFLQNEWVSGVQPFRLYGSREESRNKILADLATEAISSDTIDYKRWMAPEALVLPDVPGYSLFVLLDGQIGLNKSFGKGNTLFLFVVDNAKRHITYSDVMSYECDIRNTDGLARVMDHAYLKLLNVRFPEKLHKAQ